MGWKIVEVENSQKLSLFLQNLVVLCDDNKITIPIKDIDVLLINNFKLSITVQLINALTSENVLVIICNNNYLPESIIVPIIGNYNTLKVLENQLNWNHIFKSRMWKQIIKNKIENQANLVLEIVKDLDAYKNLCELKEDIKEYDISNREGHASKIYWHSLFTKEFKRFEDDYENKLLNYGYTILRSYVTRSIIKKGLDPRISIFHKSFHNYFALASDLMEPFRIVIDYEVYKIHKENSKSFYDDKQRLINCFNNKIYVNNQLHFINNAIDLYIDAIVNQSDFPVIKMNYELV